MSDVPSATVVQDGKVPGDVPKGGAGGPPRVPYKRKLSNYLLDKGLQLRYVLLVTIMSGIIAGSLGYLIYHQRHTASASVERDLAADSSFAGVLESAASKNDADDRAIVYKMVGVGVGLIVILSLFLVFLTHKVAGPLYKVSMYFDRMANGRVGVVTALRRGDMLQDFYGNFREMHEAVRGRLQDDVGAMDKAVSALRDASKDEALAGSLATAAAHVEKRRKQLA